MGKRGEGSVYARGKTWWIKYYEPGNPSPIRESSESTSKEDAEALLRKRLKGVKDGSAPATSGTRVRMGELFEMLIQDYIDHERRDLYILKARIRTHLKSEFAHLRAADVGTDHAKKYIAKRKSEKAANATINRELAILRRSFKLGLRCDPPKVNRIPFLGEDLPEDNARQGFIEYDAYRRLYEKMDRARLALVIGFHIGNRKGEILKLEWSMVDFEEKQIRIPGRLTKNKKPRKLPMYGDLEVELGEALAERNEKWPECPWVVSADGERIRCFKAEWAKACEAAGIKGLMFHDLRRSAVRNMKRAGIDDKEAMQISGHLTRAVFDRYNIVSDTDVEDAGEKLRKYLDSKKTPKKGSGKVISIKKKASEAISR